MSLNNPLATYFNSWITLPSLFTALPVDVYWLDLHYVGIRNTTLCQRFPNNSEKKSKGLYSCYPIRQNALNA